MKEGGEAYLSIEHKMETIVIKCKLFLVDGINKLKVILGFLNRVCGLIKLSYTIYCAAVKVTK